MEKTRKLGLMQEFLRKMLKGKWFALIMNIKKTDLS